MAEVDVQRVQKTLLKMAKTIAGILEANNIPYMIAYGTLLGAVRHQGFIPWDDDFDFYLFDESYDKAIEILRLNLPNDMFLEDEKSEPLYFHSWAHVKDIYSIAECREFPQDSLYTHKGISVDLYRAKNCKFNEVKKYLNEENYAYINRRLKLGLIGKEDYDRRLAIWKHNVDEEAKSRLEDEHECFALINFYKMKTIEFSDIFELRKYKFEDTEFYGPINADKILTGIYGEYMKFPPFEKRTCHYSRVIFISNLKNL